MNLNIKTVFFLSQAVAKQFIVQGMAVKLSILPPCFLSGGIRVPSYTASKSAVMGVTDFWRMSGLNMVLMLMPSLRYGNQQYPATSR